MNNTASSDVMVPMTKGKRFVFLYATMIMSAAYMAAGYGAGNALPRMLGAMDAFNQYPLANALGALGFMISLPIVGKLCDKFGIKAVCITGVILQFIGRFSIMYISNSYVFLVTYFLTQFFAGLYTTSPYTLIADVVEGNIKPTYYGFLATFNAFGSLLGPVITGIVLDRGLIPYAFIVYAPLMLISVPFIAAFYPNRKTSKVVGKFDFLSIFLLFVSMAGLVLWLTQSGNTISWTSPLSIAFAAVGVIGLIMLFRVSGKNPNPTVALHMFRYKRFRYSFLTQVFAVAFSSTLTGYVVAFAQNSMGVSATVTGTFSMPMTIVRAIIGAAAGAFLAQNFKKRFRPLVICSLALTFIGAVLIATLSSNSTVLLIYLASGLAGFGSVIPQATFAPFYQSELRREDFPAGAGMFSFGSNVGTTVFSASAGVILNNFSGGEYGPVFILTAVFCFFAVFFAVIGMRFPKEESAE